jgi:hypothetical protein
MWKFDMSSGSTQPADPIYYLHGEHGAELVLRRFFEHNPDVLKYRSPHGIKIAIGKHQSSWKEVGQDVVDELVEKGIDTAIDFEQLVVVFVHEDDVLQYCFEASISEPINTTNLPIADESEAEARPV